MSAIQVPKIFVLRKTRPQIEHLGDGYVRRDLRPYMREDIAENIQLWGAQSQNDPAGQKITQPLSPVDFPFARIRAAAKDFKHRDQKTGQPARLDWDYGVIKKRRLLNLMPQIEPSLRFFFLNPKNPENDELIFREDIVKNVTRIVKDAESQEQLLDILEDAHYDTYRRRVGIFWYLASMRIDINDLPYMRVDLAKKENTYAEFIEVETLNRYKALEVKGKKSLAASFLSSLAKTFPQVKPFVQLPDEGRNIMWDGYLEQYNFWPMFRYDPNAGTGQVDDLRDPIKGLYVSPYGNFTIEYRNRTRLDIESLRNAAIVASICYNTPFLEDNLI